MGTTKEEMKPSTRGCEKQVKTVNVADMVGGKKGGFLERMKVRLQSKSPEQRAKKFADLIEDFSEQLEQALAVKAPSLLNFRTGIAPTVDRIDLRLRDMILNKRKELKEEDDREAYNQRALGRLQTIDWNFESIKRILNATPNANVTDTMQLEYIEWHFEEIGRLIVEYGEDN